MSPSNDAGDAVRTRSRLRGDRLLPARGRQLLPGFEPGRELDDWGRSERLERILQRTVGTFLYDCWFRVEAQGAERIPASGGALIVSHRAGLVPAHAAMIARVVSERHGPGRRLYVLTEPTVRGLPGLDPLLTKLGCVSAVRANIERLLCDEGELVLAFPEPRRMSRKPLAQRYRVAPFEDLAPITIARRARVPILVAAVLGAEEAQPVFFTRPRLPRPLRDAVGVLRRLGRRAAGPPLALAETLPGLAAPPYLPAKMLIHFEHVRDPGEEVSDASFAVALREALRTSLERMLAERRSVWLG